MQWIKQTLWGLGRMLTLLIAVSMTAFILVTLSPTDPVQAYVGAGVAVSPQQRAEIAAYWGLDAPPAQQYAKWVNALLHGDLGSSLIYRRPVAEVIGERFAASLALMSTAWILSGILGLGFGILMGYYANRLPDRIFKPICLTLSCTPAFWVGMVLIMIFSVSLGWFPVGLAAPAGILAHEVTIWQKIHHLILPACTLAMVSFSGLALHIRAKLIEILSSDYVLFAAARGETSASVLWRHCLRNLMPTAITLQFHSFRELFGGAVLAEQVFSYSGLGQAAVAAGLRADIPLLLGITLCSALFVFVGNALSNLFCRLADPRIREVERN